MEAGMNDLYIEDGGEGLKNELRGTTAYSTLRLLIEILFWVAVVSSVAWPLLYLLVFSSYVQPPVQWVVGIIVISALNILIACVVRGLALALLDIADVQLRQAERNHRRNT